MRKLIVLRGAMGCGKSTFIKEHKLENFTLSSDQIRLMLNAPKMTVNCSEEIPQFNNKKAWEFLYTILEERMKKGEFTIIDAVHARADESFPIYKKLAEKYRYRLYILDFTDLPKEEVYKRNRMREEYRIVPEEVIDRAYETFSKEKMPSSFRVIKPENFDEIVNEKPKNLNKYDKVHVIGDIHGCYSALKKYFEKRPMKENDAYIFIGDYFDRGIENFKTFEFLSELLTRENTVFLLGNHEDKLYKYACNDEFKMDYDIKNTIEEFEKNGISKSEIRAFIKRLSQISHIEFGKNTYLISHGGIPYIPKQPLDFYSTDSFVYGIDKYEVDIDKIYDEFMRNEKDKTYQIHGHRNYYKNKYDEYEYSLNLEGDIEHGGYLRILTLNKNKALSYTEIKNDTYNPNLIEETKVYNLVESLRKNKYIIKRDLGDGIYSFNFSKDAFYNKIWDNMTTRARGLFIDITNYKILARSYNKFFKIGERKETELKNLEKTLSFPAKFYLKYNGFLGILSVKNDELFFASKSTNVGEYVEYFKTIFYKKFDEKQIEAIKNKIAKDDVTVLFEVIDNANDPHIIEYEESELILLDMIYNKTDYSKISYEDLREFADDVGISTKELIYTADNLESFKNIYENITSEDYKLADKYVEGFVIEDSDNFMVKTKTFYYDTWKYLRTKMENALKNGNYKSKTTMELELSFMQYLKTKYENKEIDLKSIDIITERREFEKYENEKM